MPGYEVAKYDLIWICDSGIRGELLFILFISQNYSFDDKMPKAV